MTAYRVVIKQLLRENDGSNKDASFVEYVETLVQASHIVNRFHSMEPAEREYRHIVSINIETIHIQTV